MDMFPNYGARGDAFAAAVARRAAVRRRGVAVSSATAAPPGRGPRRTPRRTARPRPRSHGRVGGWLQRLDSPVTSYYVLLGVTVVLVVIGLIMVLSASSVKSLRADQQRHPLRLLPQAAAVRRHGCRRDGRRRRGCPLRAWKALAVPILVGALLLQLLVFTPLGVSVNGNRNWLALGPVTLQPSEFAKIGLVLVGATVLSAKRSSLGQLRHVVVPFLVPGRRRRRSAWSCSVTTSAPSW